MAFNYPPVLITAAMASVPVVMALSYTVVLKAQGYVNQAEELKLGIQVMRSSASSSPELGASLFVLDRNQDGMLSKRELEGLISSLGSIGFHDLGDQIFTVADVNTDGKLGPDEGLSFIERMRVTGATIGVLTGAISPPELLAVLDDGGCLNKTTVGYPMAMGAKVLSIGND